MAHLTKDLTTKEGFPCPEAVGILNFTSTQKVETIPVDGVPKHRVSTGGAYVVIEWYATMAAFLSGAKPINVNDKLALQLLVNPADRKALSEDERAPFSLDPDAGAARIFEALQAHPDAEGVMNGATLVA